MKYKAVLIGCGRISFKHIEALVNNCEEVELVAVCDVIKEKAAEKANEYKKHIPGANVLVFTDYKQLLKMKPDIAVIATITGYHPKISIDAIKGGAHVIVEKPMALSTKDAETMIKTAKKHKRKLSVCYQNRFNESIIKTYEALKMKRFGKMLNGMIQVRWNRNNAYYKKAGWRGTWALDGGTLMNQCTHGIDLLQWLMGGDVVRVYGVTRRFLKPIEAEDFGSAIIEFKSGAVGIIEGSADVYPINLNETLSLFGEKGTVVIGGLAVNKIETWRFSDNYALNDHEDKVIGQNAKDPPNVYGFGHSMLYRDFLEAIKHNRKPLIDGEAGKKSLEIILAIYKSMKEGRLVKMPVNYDTIKMKGIFK